MPGETRDAASPLGAMKLWVRERARESSVASAVAGLDSALPRLLGGDAARRYLDALAARLDAVAALAPAEQTGPIAPASPMLARWGLAARQLAAAHAAGAADPMGLALNLARRGNVLASAAVASALAETTKGAGHPASVRDALRRIAVADQAPFRDLSLPPAPGASWRPDDYLVPARDDATVDRLRVLLAAAPAAQAIWKVFDSGYPVPRDGLARLAEKAADGGDEALNLLRAARPAPATPPGPNPEGPGHAARAELARLGAELERPGDSWSATLRRHLADALADDDAASPAGLLRRVLAILIYLDGMSPTPPGCRAARDRLAAVGRSLGLIELTGPEVVGRPVEQLAGRVKAVGIDQQAPAGAPSRVTRVDRPGYAVQRADGVLDVLLPARVWIST